MDNEQRAGIELYYKVKAASKRAAQWFKQQWKEIKRTLGDTATAIAGTTKQLEAVAPWVQGNAQFAADLGASYQEVTEKFGKAAAAGVDWEQAASRSAQITEDLGDAAEDTTGKTRNLADSLRRMGRFLGFALVFSQLYFALLNFQKALIETAKDIHGQTEEARMAEDALKKLKGALVLLVTGPDVSGELYEIAKAINSISDAALQTRATLQALTEQTTMPEWLETGLKEGLGPGQYLMVKLMLGQLRGGWEEFLEQRGVILDQLDTQLDDYVKGTEQHHEQLRRLHQALAEYEPTGPSPYQTLLSEQQQALESSLESQLDQWRSYNQRVIDLGRQHAQAMADLERDVADRSVDIWRGYYDKLEDLQSDLGSRRQQVMGDYHRKMLGIELSYQQRLRAIQNQYAESMYDAVSERNATLALKAERRRKQQLKEAKLERKDQLKLAGEDYQGRLDELSDFQQQRRRDIQRDRDRALRDLDTYQDRQERDLKRAYGRQLDDLERHHDQQLAEIDSQYDAEIIRADAHYRGMEERYLAHLRYMLSLEKWYAGQSGGNWGGTGTNPPDNPWHFQKGGAFVTSRPQTMTVGEGGRPELVQITPLSGTMTHQHNIGDVNQRVAIRVEQAITGMQGRMEAMFREGMRGLFR
jgi:hypothetical protein